MKVLVLGSVEDTAEELERFRLKVMALHGKHGPFDALFAFIRLSSTGAAIPDFRPVPVYLVPAEGSEETGRTEGALLGSHGFLALENGLGVAFVGGSRHDTSAEQTTDGLQVSKRIAYTDSDLQKLARSIPKDRLVDLLFTSDWPSAILNRSRLKTNIPTQRLSNDALDSFVSELRPRYHFAIGQTCFFQREPYKNASSEDQTNESYGSHSTRFIGLGDFTGNPNKERWFYAMTLVPGNQMEPADLLKEQEGATESPFISGQGKRELDSAEFASTDRGGRAKTRRPPDDYLCRICSEPGHFIRDCPRKTDHPQKRALPSGYVCNICKEPGHFIQDCPKKDENPRQASAQGCWFCLSNPNIAQHLIVSIGEEIYLCLPKGELVPQHILLVAVDHVSDSQSTARGEMREELERYKHALKKFFLKQGKAVVFFETRFRSHHMNIQAVPIPQASLHGLRKAFEDLEEGVKFQEFRVDEHDSESSFFRIEFPAGEHLIYYPTGRFNVQLGRKVLANHLGIPERVDWKSCQKTRIEEERDAESFKAAFAPFDFTLGSE